MNDMGSTSYNYRLDAISWKCQQTGLTYGQLMNSYGRSELNKIYAEYREVLNARKEKNRQAGNSKKPGNAERKVR